MATPVERERARREADRREAEERLREAEREHRELMNVSNEMAEKLRYVDRQRRAANDEILRAQDQLEWAKRKAMTLGQRQGELRREYESLGVRINDVWRRMDRLTQLIARSGP